MKEEKEGGCVRYIIIVFVSVFLLLNIWQNLSSDKEKSISDMETMAVALSQHYMSQKLQSPGTASYPWGGSRFDVIDDNTCKVTSYVDSQNGFGAVVRTDYQVTLDYNGGDWEDPNNWSLVYLETK